MGNDLPPLWVTDPGHGGLTSLPRSVLQSVVVPIVVIADGIMEGIGTAFNIAPGGLWVTARHVMDDVENACEINPGAEPYLMWVGSGAGKDVPDLEGALSQSGAGIPTESQGLISPSYKHSRDSAATNKSHFRA